MTGSVSSLGVGAGLDLNSILSKLMAAERQPLASLESRITAANAKISTFGRLKARLETLASASNKLSSAFNLNAVTATSSEATVATASAAFNATAGKYAIDVTQLASAQKSFSNEFAPTTTFGQGSLEFTIDGDVKTVNLTDQASYTLQDIRAKIADANIGISATVVSGTGGDRLVFSGAATGSSGAFTIAAGAGSDVSLTTLASFDTTTIGLARSTAQDALFSVEGVSATASTNTSSTVVNGLTISLLKTGTTTLTVATDNTKVTEAVQAFVDAYNGINSLIKENSSYDTSTKKAQPLNGESTVRTIQGLISTTRTTVPATLSVATYQTLSSLGISAAQDGSLSLDSAKLSGALSSNQTEVLKTLNAYGAAFNTALTNIQTTDGVIQSRINGLGLQVKSYNDNKSTLEIRISRIEARYRAQFISLDKLVSSLQTTSSYLSQQLGS